MWHTPHIEERSAYRYAYSAYQAYHLLLCKQWKAWLNSGSVCLPTWLEVIVSGIKISLELKCTLKNKSLSFFLICRLFTSYMHCFCVQSLLFELVLHTRGCIQLLSDDRRHCLTLYCSDVFSSCSFLYCCYAEGTGLAKGVATREWSRWHPWSQALVLEGVLPTP